jgi:hypothetical protein
LKTTLVSSFLFFVVSVFAAAQSGNTTSGAAQRKIPILISDHHADHALYLLRQVKKETATLLVLDAHSDTEPHPEYDRVRDFISSGNYTGADNYMKNQNWIHPLTPWPVSSLVWIDKISGFPDAEPYHPYFFAAFFLAGATATSSPTAFAKSVSVPISAMEAGSR